MHFSALFSLVSASLMLGATAGVSFKLVTGDQFMDWLATTDANLTFVGPPAGTRDFETRQTTTMVTYCTKRIDDICGGTCQVYDGGAHNVGFCDKGGCGGSCNELSSCGTSIANGFCDTPGTASILVAA
ncbi:hypothetical protein B0H17DRAFT_1158486 [Mycena rosella]|uniref:Uncharacterized protein n=1 Tax=Mycena rosella TaxID=1033263 RepID=A0AAD7DQ87_MYCRO|nr:hypothetical protein B0H17DRAFT_1158486 [Mycena rosella]